MASCRRSRMEEALFGTLAGLLFLAGSLAADVGPERAHTRADRIRRQGNLPPAARSGDWPVYSHDYDNSNFAAAERLLSRSNVRFLRRAWETFNDDREVAGDPPTGFVLESVLGLRFPSAVVGVVASPVVRDGTIYYVDALGTVFARNARTGGITDPAVHWTTTLVDPDFDGVPTPVLPELVYTAPIITDEYVWVLGSSYGELHLLERRGGREIDFDPGTAEIDPFRLVADLPFSSILGDAVVIESHGRTLLVAGINIILNDALVQGEEGGMQIALDVSDPTQPVEVWRRSTLERDPATGLRFGSGVSAGSGLAVDFGRGLVIGGTGQNTSDPYPGHPDPSLSPSAFVDRSDSLYAIDFETGRFAWTNQFHRGDVFNLNAPVSTGPNQPNGPRDADVLAPPILFSVARHGRRDLAADGSKGGLFRAVDRDTGETVWERKISKGTGIGGIQAGAAVADGVVYVAGFEGIDDGFSDAQFGVSLGTGLFPNAFFATFSPAFWADVEDVADDADPATGMRIKVYALDGATGRSLWHTGPGRDYVELRAGAALRHVSVANGLVFVTSSSGQLFVLDADDGDVLFHDQSIDLNEMLDLGLGKPHHASMNGGTVISSGMVYVPYGAQNNPSGGLIAYALNHAPLAESDLARLDGSQPVVIDALGNDRDPDGDGLRFASVAGREINVDDASADIVHLGWGTVEVFNPGDDPSHPHASYLRVVPTRHLRGSHRFSYQVEDLAPPRVVNGVALEEPEPTHAPRRAGTFVTLVPDRR